MEVSEMGSDDNGIESVCDNDSLADVLGILMFPAKMCETLGFQLLTTYCTQASKYLYTGFVFFCC